MIDPSQMLGRPTGGENILHQLGLDQDTLSSFSDSISRGLTDKRICVCGHPIIRHSKGESGYWACTWGKLWCPCQAPIPVLTASNVKFFQMRTRGVGERHALSLGIYKSIKNEIELAFTPDVACFKCDMRKPSLKPVSLDRNFRVLDIPGHYNGLFCPECLFEMTGLHL